MWRCQVQACHSAGAWQKVTDAKDPGADFAHHYLTHHYDQENHR